MSRVLAVTGANGYIGRALVGRARPAWQVVALGRRAVPGCTLRACALDAPFDPAVLEGVDAVVHLAADTTGTSVAAGSEVAFATALAAAAQARGIPLVVASSQVASPSAPSAYGRTKAAIEAAVLPLGAIVIRPGLVYGGEPRGLFGMLVTACRRLPVLPDLRPRPAVQPVHVDDVADAMLAALDRPWLRGRALAVAGRPLAFGAFLEAIARHRLHRPRPRMPVPIAPLRLALALASRLLGPALSPARLDSLVRIPQVDARDDLAQLGIVLRPLEAGLAPGRGRRALLAEGDRLARAFLRRPAGGAVLRRYARALPALGIADADAALARLPRIALPAIDTPRARQRVGAAAWRVGVLLRLAEADPRLSSAFLVGERAGLARFALDVLRAVQFEIAARLLRPWARRRLGESS